MVTVSPVLDGSVMLQDSRTVWFPPWVTAFGLAPKEFMLGAGQDMAVTVTWAEELAPQPLVTVIV